MFRKLFLFAFVLLSFSVISAQEKSEPASASFIAKVKLPAGAARVFSGIPAEINRGLEEIIKAGKGTVIGGKREVLFWTGGSRKKGLVKQIENNLRSQGWEYEVGVEENGVTFFSALRETPTRQAVLGFFVNDRSGLTLALTEVLPANFVSPQQPENK